MNMVERVARAIAESEGNHPDGIVLDGMPLWSCFTTQARAAIESMREPTEKMVYHADGFTDLVGPYPEANTPEERRAEFGCAWQAMIDAALAE